MDDLALVGDEYNFKRHANLGLAGGLGQAALGADDGLDHEGIEAFSNDDDAELGTLADRDGGLPASSLDSWSLVMKLSRDGGVG